MPNIPLYIYMCVCIYACVCILLIYSNLLQDHVPACFLEGLLICNFYIYYFFFFKNSVHMFKLGTR